MNEVETTATMDITVDEKQVSPSGINETKVSPGKRQRIKNTLRSLKSKKRTSGTYDGRFYGEVDDKKMRFWTSPILILQYMIVVIAIVSQRLWVLQGILVILSAHIAYVVYSWILYIIRDPDLQKAIVSMRWYFGFACRQAEKTVQGKTGRRMLEGSVLAWRGTATAFMKWFFRQRSQNVNQVMIQQHQANMERLKQFRM